MNLQKLLEPITIGRVRIKNRIFRPPHGTHMGDGAVTDDLIAYHEARAIGGVGLSIIEGMAVHPSCPTRINGWDPRLEDGYRRLMDAVRPHGMAIFQQIWHGGANFLASAADGNPIKMAAPWSSSDLPSPAWGITPIPMTKTMIDDVIEGFASTAERCERGGLNGVEVHGAHGYLVQQFLSPLLNKREDDYGGDAEGRIRFLLEILRAIRARVSGDFAVGLRISPELVPGGLNVPEIQAISERLEQEGLIDFLDLSMGSYHSVTKTIGGMHEPTGYELETSGPIAQRSTVARLITGRYRTLEEAEQTLRQSAVDMIGFVRAMIAEPELVKKTLEGRVDEVRPCIGCNQGCLMGVFQEGRVGCAVNPAVGRERTLSDNAMGKATARKRVVVVGGGPAGLEAARTAALRGHDVVLFEASPNLGGAVNLAALCPTRRGIRDITLWLEQEVFRLGVDVRLSTYADAGDVLAEQPDAILIAVGSIPRMDGIQQLYVYSPIEGFAQSGALSTVDLLTSDQRYDGREAIVIDDLGHYEAIGCAEFLIDRGAMVTFATRHRMIGHLVTGAFTVTPALERMNRDGKLRLRTLHRVLGVADGVARIVPTYGGPEESVGADSVVFVSANQVDRSLFNALDGQVPLLRAIGDAATPRFLQTAIAEGREHAFAV
jgi:2,4-dienoyl-CoA reductase-like NADH-dependent reductase (Old Yellow Enzyme family)